MKLADLIALIDQEQALSARIDAEIDRWVKPHQGSTALRLALRAFGGGSLRKSAKALGVSPTYLSQCASGKVRPTRRLMRRVHEVYGVGGVA